ncbi:Battenin [Nymphon striatum]|nr:Battenin [Nymphon striatum]
MGDNLSHEPKGREPVWIILNEIIKILLQGLASQMWNVGENGNIYEKENDSDAEVQISTSGNAHNQTSRSVRIRNLTAYWLLGMTNNYAYVVMLSAAHDILSTQWNGGSDSEHKHHATNETGYLVSNGSSNDIVEMKCNKAGTAAILLADILPSLIIKSLSSFLPSYTHFRIAIVVVLCMASFLITSYSTAYWMSFLGVICASLCSGLGEITFVGYAAFFDKDVISTWSSGTGGAGLFGALSYMALTQVGVSPRNSLLIMLFVPVLMAFSFWILLVHPPGLNHRLNCCNPASLFQNKESSTVTFIASQNISDQNKKVIVPFISIDDSDSDDKTKKRSGSNLSNAENHRAYSLGLKEKLNVVKKIFLPLMLPLAVVYIAEYFINQALMEVLYFPNIWLTPAEQYRWYQADYQFGVLISRSSVNFLTIKRTWILGVLQFLNVAILLAEVFFRFMPSFWIIIVFIFYEGLLGGSAYVNTFYRISKEMNDEEKEYALSVTTVSDSCGVALAGAIGVPSHSALCSLPYKRF